jgi:hypothetical protein
VTETGTLQLKIQRKPMLAIGGLTLLGALGAGAVLAVHHVPQAGPFIANSLRKVIGIQGVANLEEMVASAEDRVMRLRDQPSRSLSEMSPSIIGSDIPLAVAAPLASAPIDAAINRPASAVDAQGALASLGAPEPLSPLAPVFTPVPVQPPYPEVAAPGDGVWVPVPDPEHPEAPALMYKTLLHPDPERRYAELFIVAMPSALIQLTSVPGTEEPASDNPATASIPGRGVIPQRQQGELLAAFNGGFRAEHGHHGMMVNGVTIVPPRADMCSVFGYEDGSLQIGTYSRLAAQPEKPIWYRQTPRCMVERGTLHPGLRDPNARGWGATLEGETVIRRSAIALSEDGQTLLMAVTNFTTARALALGMRAAGGYDVAQLDVNRSFPKFLLFPRDESGVRRGASLFSGFLYQPAEMIDQPNLRDFFFVTRRPRDERTEVTPPAAPSEQAG